MIPASYPTIDTPSFLVDEALLKRNLAIFEQVKERTGCKILLALKGFAMHRVFPLLCTVLDGICASSPHEARLGREMFRGEVHAFAAAYRPEHIEELTWLADHVLFNSFSQYHAYAPGLLEHGVHVGLRVNPQHTEGWNPMYDPCAPGSRLGITRDRFHGHDLSRISGLHFHNLCEQNSDSLQRTLQAFEEKFGEFIPGLEYVNFGGGHHITRDDYDLDLLCTLINTFKARYGVQVYLEPGEAVALNTGYLVTQVLDIVHNSLDIAIMDTAVPAHMPDVLEVPYRPGVLGPDGEQAGEAGEKEYTYRLAGISCLAGDVAGDYSFSTPLQPGDKIAFTDMAHYTMVKTNTFNGIGLPSIYYQRDNATLELVKRFGYQDFKQRLS